MISKIILKVKRKLKSTHSKISQKVKRGNKKKTWDRQKNICKKVDFNNHYIKCTLFKIN